MPSRRRAARALGLILLLTAALYAPSLRNGFTYDDAYVAAAAHPSGRPNPLIAELRPLPEYFLAHYWKGEHAARGEYRPVTVLSYALTYRALGRTAAGEAFPQHALNLLLHLCATALVYRLLRAVRARREAALLGALVFGVHAVHSEVVASVVGRAELLAFTCGALSLLLALGRGGAPRLLGAAGALFLALGSKESALAWAPFLWLVWIARALRRDPACALGAGLRAGGLRALGVSVAPLAAFLALRAQVLAGLPQPLAVASVDANPLAHVPAFERLLSAVMIYGVAMVKTVLPLHLASDYGRAVFRLAESPGDPRFLLSGALLIALGAGGLASLRRRTLLFLAAASFLGFSFLTSNIPLAIGTIFGERLLYAPSLGLSFAVAWLGEQRLAAGRAGRMGTAVLLAALVAWLCASGLVILQRNAAWRSNAALYLTDAAAQPRSIKLNVLAADVYRERGETVRQFEHLGRAVALDAQPARAWLRLALLFLERRSWLEADEAARRGVQAATSSGAAYGFQLAWLRSEVARALGREAAAGALRAEALGAYRRLRESPALLDEVLDHPLDVGAAAGAWAGLAADLEKRGAAPEAERALRIGLGASRLLPAAHRFPLH
ncbi:MAG TPA: hypothetical protein VIY27_04635, partial [Myxococcota bacterium]